VLWLTLSDTQATQKMPMLPPMMPFAEKAFLFELASCL